jgi:hypothetical protein
MGIRYWGPARGSSGRPYGAPIRIEAAYEAARRRCLSLSLSYFQKTAGSKALLMSWPSLLKYSYLCSVPKLRDLPLLPLDLLPSLPVCRPEGVISSDLKLETP